METIVDAVTILSKVLDTVLQYCVIVYCIGVVLDTDVYTTPSSPEVNQTTAEHALP